MKRLNGSRKKAQYIKLIILQCCILYYILAVTVTYLSSTNAYFEDNTYASIQIKNKDTFYSQKDSSSLAAVKSWIENPETLGSFINNGGDMLVDTTWSVYKQIQGNNWELLETYPLKALKSKETRVLEYKPKESGIYRFVVEQVPTHAGESKPKIETPYFDYGKLTNQTVDE